MADELASKADGFASKADKKLKSLGWFGNKYEEAVELLDKAANNYKLAKKWREAGQQYEKLVVCHQKLASMVPEALHSMQLDSKHEAASAWVDAANAYKKVSNDEAVRCLKCAVDIFTDMGRLSMAAKHYKEIAELYEKDERWEDCIIYYSQAADFFGGEEVNSSSNQCKLKVAQYSAQLENYKKAIELYEEVAKKSMDNNLLRYSVKGYLLCAGICHLGKGDLNGASNALDKYQDLDSTFTGSRECKFLQDLLGALEEGDVQKFSTVVYEFDNMTRLDPWKTTMLLRIKKQISSKETEEVDLT
eukprot:jgi/Chlat1/6139/Chrsp41S05690